MGLITDNRTVSSCLEPIRPDGSVGRLVSVTIADNFCVNCVHCSLQSFVTVANSSLVGMLQSVCLKGTLRLAVCHRIKAQLQS